MLLGVALLAAAPLLEERMQDERASGIIFTAGLLLTMVACTALAVRLLRLLAGLLFHRVRSRIIANYVLTGVLPLLLVFMLVASLSHFFMLQLASTQLKQAIEREFLRLEAAAVRSSYLVNESTDTLSAECRGFLEREYAGFRLAVTDSSGTGDSLTSLTVGRLRYVPACDSLQGSFLVMQDTVFLAVSVPAGACPGGRPLVLAVPIRGRLLEEIERELGGNCMFSYGTGITDEQPEPGRGSLNFQISAGPEGSSGFSFTQSSDLERRVNEWTMAQPDGFPHIISYSLNAGFLVDDEGMASEVMVLGLVSTTYTFVAGRIIQGAIPEDVPMKRVFLWGAIILAAIFSAIELVALIISLVLSRSITKTIAQLHKKADCVARGDFSYRINSERKDQLGLLANSFDRMSDSLELLLEQVKEKERIEHELAIAQEVQRIFFPKSFPEVNGISLLGRCLPARMVSGDYYDCIPHQEGMIDFFIGDISGKGISAALLMAGSQTFLRSEAARRPLPPVTRIVESFNKYLVQYSAEGKFSSLFYGRLDPAKRTLTCCNAGHPRPFLFRRGVVTELTVGGLIPGVLPTAPYGEETIQLEEGDLLVAFTDGFTEAFNPDDQEFGEKRLSDTVEAYLKESLEGICDHLVKTIDSWSAARVQADDMTIFLVRVG